MNTKKLTLMISFFVIAAISMFVTLSWIDNSSERNNTESNINPSFLKFQKTNNNPVAKDNWSQKKQKIKGTLKADAPDKFAEAHVKIRTARDEVKPGYERNYRFTELEKAKMSNSLMKSSINTAALAALNWVERGPANVGGRTRSIVVDPDDAAFGTWFAGAVGRRCLENH